MSEKDLYKITDITKVSGGGITSVSVGELLFSLVIVNNCNSADLHSALHTQRRNFNMLIGLPKTSNLESVIIRTIRTAPLYFDLIC